MATSVDENGFGYDIPDYAFMDPNSGIVYDARSNPPRVIGRREDYAIDMASVGSMAQSGPLTPGDRKRATEANVRELGVNAGIGGIAQLAQMGLGAIPTATDTRNKEKLDQLNEMERTGRMGLSADERALAESTMMNPVRTLATESRQRGEGQLAAMGNTSLAAQNAVRLANDQAVTNAAVRAGQEITRANIEAKRLQERELEQRTKDEAEKQAATLDRMSQTIGGLAKIGGRIAAAQVAKREPTDNELLTMARATGGDNKPLNPEYAGKSADEIRQMQKDEEKAARGLADIDRQREASKRKLERRMTRDMLRDDMPEMDMSSLGATSDYGGF